MSLKKQPEILNPRLMIAGHRNTSAKKAVNAMAEMLSPASVTSLSTSLLLRFRL